MIHRHLLGRLQGHLLCHIVNPRAELTCAHGSSCLRVHLDFCNAGRVHTHGHNGALPEIVLDRHGSAHVFKVLLDHWEPGSRPADVSFFRSVGGGHAKLECTFLVFDSRALICKPDGIASIQDRNDGFGEVRVNVVFDNFANDHKGDGAALLSHAAIHRVGRLLEIRAHVCRLNYADMRRGEHVVIDRNTR